MSVYSNEYLTFWVKILGVWKWDLWVPSVDTDRIGLETHYRTQHFLGSLHASYGYGIKKNKQE